MKFTLSWLHEHLATKAGLDEIVEAMVAAGLEVESVDNPAADLAAFTIARVRAAEPHPDADRLRVCTVDTKDGEKTIVCGAPNARAGMTAVYAPLGTYIPGLNLALDKKPRKIRGVESHGMLCSAAELQFGDDHDGILDLAGEWKVGTPAAEALGANDPVIDFEVTPNRPDWLGVMGIARDLAAAGLGRLVSKDVKAADGSFDCPIEIILEAEEACPVFMGALVEGVRNGPSPDWMQARLKAVGLQPRNLLVDVTNYVSLDRARPLHVYDVGKLSGVVRARLGREGETLAALDGKTYALTPDMCVIADDSGAIGLGGVMGGTSTAVDEATTTVFIESAWFDPPRTARTGRTTGILSDARYRFERGVDPLSCGDGLNLAIQLITRHGGGEVSRPRVAGGVARRSDKVNFKPADVERLTGLKVRPASMRRMLKELGFGIEDAGDAWYLDAPSWRFDMVQSADIVEEIARLEGFDTLPLASLPPPAGGVGQVTTPLQARVRTGRRLLAARGYQEAVTWSFMAKADAEHFGGGQPELAIANPVASELDQMRPSALANLARAIQRAGDRGERHLRLFEAGPIYRGDGQKDQRTVIAALLRPDGVPHWQGPAGEDAFTVRDDVYRLLEAIDQSPDRFQLHPARSAHWHPGQSASLRLGPKTMVAEFGALHPRVLRVLDVAGPLYGFELVLEALPQPRTRGGKTRAKLTAADQTPVHRDLAFLVDETVPAGELLRLALGADQDLVRDAHVFDVYTGKGVPEGQVSLAIEVTLRPSGAPLTDAEIEAVIAKVVKAIETGVGGRLRG